MTPRNVKRRRSSATSTASATKTCSTRGWDFGSAWHRPASAECLVGRPTRSAGVWVAHGRPSQISATGSRRASSRRLVMAPVGAYSFAQAPRDWKGHRG